MAYRVLARKYRPQTFEEMIGQGHVAQTLSNALKSGKVAHAYLFSGPRGVGKTTTARLLAKALNCEKGPSPIPCNRCDSCERIAQGQENVDVLEIDAASNRGIEEIRELRDNVRYAPARSRYKVYIVDEAHQITHDAFNAFLKTLEEPPEHAVFILATTEHQKIPATILSRCQLFRFKRVSAEEGAALLGRLLEREGIQAEPQALARLAKASGGSVRDSLSLLDQALSFMGGDQPVLSAKQVELLLGFLPDDFLVGFASALLEQKPDGVLRWIKQLVEEGWEPQQFVKDFREFLRETIVSQLAEAPASARGASAGALQLAGRSVSLAQVLHMLKLFGSCLEEMRWNENPQLVLEMYSLRLAQPFVDVSELMDRLSRLEGAAAAPSRLPAEAPRQMSVEPPPMRAAAAPAIPRAVPTSTAAAPAARPSDAAAPPVAADPAGVWKRFLAEAWKKPSIASHLERARLRSMTATEWTIGFPDAFAMAAVQRAQSFIEELAQKLTEQPVRVKFVAEAPDRREGSATVSVSAGAPERTDAQMSGDVLEAPAISVAPQGLDPAVQNVLDVFKGRIRAE